MRVTTIIIAFILIVLWIFIILEICNAKELYGYKEDKNKAKEFLDKKQEEHFKQFGVYADVNSKLAEWMQEYKDKQL